MSQGLGAEEGETGQGRRSLSSRLWKLLVTDDSPVESRGRHGSFEEETSKWFMGAWNGEPDGECFKVTKFQQGGRGLAALKVWLLLPHSYRPGLVSSAKTVLPALSVCFRGCPGRAALTGNELRESRGLCTWLSLQP